MPTSRKKKSVSRSRNASAGRRSRSRTRKTNQFLLVGRENSLSQTRLKVNAHSNSNGQSNHFQRARSSSNERHNLDKSASSTKASNTDNPTTIQLDMISVILFVFSFGARVWNIAYPDGIVFDEQIAGTYISNYHRREMYFSLEPPLSTQLFSLIAHLQGNFDSEFEFNAVGKEYPDGVPYVTLRVVSVVFGSLLAPITYHILRLTGASILSSILPALLVVFDPALLVQSRIFTADGQVITLSMIGLFCALKYTKNATPTSRALPWLIATGLVSALSISMKYTALFTNSLTFYIIVSKIWSDVASIRYSKVELWRRYMLFISAMIVLPFSVYMLSWGFHVTWLYKVDSTKGSPLQPSLLAALQLTEKSYVSHAVVNGSTLTLHHLHGRSCWLHSHTLLYPKRYSDGRGSSHQQQVTCYPFVDQNNRWTVVKLSDNIESQGSTELEDIYIRHGDMISFIHETTGRILNSHNVAAPLSSSKQEVAGYIDYNVSMPPQPGWIVEIDNREEDTDKWFVGKSQIKLIHFNTSAALSVTSKQLPDWAGGQFELVADPFTFHENALWTADEIVSSRRVNASNVYNGTEYNATLISVLGKIYEIHKRIFFNSFEYNDEHQYSSTPLLWPLASTNLIYWMDQTTDTQIHMLPNIPAWIFSFACLLMFILCFLVIDIRLRREITSFSIEEICGFRQQMLVAIGGFLVNMLPYFFTDQQLLLYNYLPALVFCYMSFGYLYHYSRESLSGCCSGLLVSCLAIIITVGSAAFAALVFPLAYGMGGPQLSLMKQLEENIGWKFLYEREV